MSPVARTRGAKARADRLWSEVIRLPGRCEACGDTQRLEAAHIVSRRYNRTRHQLDNGWCLCASCHRRSHDDPLFFTELVDKTIGRDAYKKLRAQTIGTCPYREADWADIADQLKAERDRRKDAPPAPVRPYPSKSRRPGNPGGRR